MKTKLILASLLILVTQAMAQKLFTLEELNFGGKNYRVSVPQRWNYSWQAGKLILKDGDKTVQVDPATGKTVDYQEPEKPLHRQYMEYSVRECGLPTKAVYIISRFHTSWGHQIIYDKETLIGLLEETGFRDITPCEVGKSEHPALNDIEGHFKELPYEFDLLETMIFEATK